MKKNLIIIILLAAAVVAVYFAYVNKSEIATDSFSGEDSEESISNEKIAIHADLLPLPSGLTWEDPVESEYEDFITNEDGDTKTLKGYEIDSSISDKKVEVFKYYNDKLTKLGWKSDEYNQLDGMIGGTAAYSKGGKHIVIDSSTDFLGPSIPESPLNCPCKYSYTIFVEK